MSLQSLNIDDGGEGQQQKIGRIFEPWYNDNFLLSIYAGFGFILFHGLHAWYHLQGDISTSHGPMNVPYALGLGFLGIILLYHSLKQSRVILRIVFMTIVFIIVIMSSWVLITRSASIVVINICMAWIVMSAIVIKSSYKEKIEMLARSSKLLGLVHDEILNTINILIQIVGLVLVGGFVPVGIYLWSVIPEGSRVYETIVLVVAWVYITFGASWFIIIESHRALRIIQNRIRLDSDKI